MTIQLSKSLHDAVDGDGAAPFEVGALTGRIRRRRVVRTGARTAVAAGAVGVVALGLVRGVGQSGPQLPAADPDAAPGTCGSDITDLPAAAAGGPVQVTRQVDKNGLLEVADGQPATLGPLLERHIDVPVSVQDLSRGEVLDMDALTAERDRLIAERFPESKSARDSLSEATRADLDARLDRLEAEINAGAVLSEARVDELDMQVLVTHRGTVVSTPVTHTEMYPLPGPAPDRGYAVLQGDLVTCSGGERPLPAGDYAVYASFWDPDTHAVTTAGPWSLALLPGPTRLAALPTGFPADVPLLAGRVVTAPHRTDDGWGYEVAVDATDSVRTARHLLDEDGVATTTVVSPGPETKAVVSSHRWLVEVLRSTTTDGEPSLVYVLRGPNTP